MGYWDFKDSCKRTAADKLLHDRSVNIAKNPRYDGYQKGLASMVSKFFDKKTTSLADKSAAFKNDVVLSKMKLCKIKS